MSRERIADVVIMLLALAIGLSCGWAVKEFLP